MEIKDKGYRLLKQLFHGWQSGEIFGLLCDDNGFDGLSGQEKRELSEQIVVLLKLNPHAFYLLPCDVEVSYAPLITNIGKRFLDGAVAGFLDGMSGVFSEMGLVKTASEDGYYALWQYGDDYYFREGEVFSSKKGRVIETYPDWFEETVKHYFDPANDNEDHATFEEWFLSRFS